MSEIKVNKLSPRSGTAVTLGDSGDTFTIPSGATLAIAGSVTGFTSAGIDDNATSVAITINSSEQVGIGTTSPSEILHIEGNSPYLVISNTGENVGGIKMYDSGGAATQYFNLTYDSGASNEVSFDTGASGEYTFNVNTVEKMRITSDGKVGIGTSSPSPDVGSDNILEIAGSTAPGLVINDTGQASKYALHAISADFVISYGSTAFFRYKPGDSQITAHDNVKIITGTSSGVTPASFAEKLFIDGIGNQGLTIGTATSGIGTIAFGDSGDNDIGKIQYQHGDNSMLFVANAAERMRIDSSGNVGIGSSAPTQKLFSAVDSTLPIPTSASMGSSTSGVANGIGIHNTNNSAQYSGLTLETKTTNASRWLIANEWKSNFNGDLVFRSRIDGSSSSEILRLKSDGKVGIGTTSPSTNLDISSGGDATINLKASGQSNGLQLSQLTSDGGSSISATNNNYLKFSTNATERMRITSAGVVGIGTSSPHSISNLHVADTYANEPMIRIETSDGGNKRLDLYVSGGHGYITATQSAQDLNFATRTNLIFKTNTSSERMRIDSSGNLLVAKTSTTRVASGAEIRPTGFGRFTRDQANPLELVRTTNDGEAIKFYKDNTNVGNISVTASSTSYNTSSDYRLKENVDYTFDATTRLKQLKPARFNFIADADTTVDGFIAHEVSSVVPEAITGTKDAVDENGNPEYQGIDQSKLVPLLVKTIQELEARITALEANNP